MRKVRRKGLKAIRLIEYCAQCKAEKCTSDCKYLIKYANYLRELKLRGEVYA